MKESREQFQLWSRLRSRLIGSTIFVSAILLIFTGRLIYIQLVKGSEYYEKSQRVIRKVTPLIAPRGEMFDRYYESIEKSTPLVTNKTRLDLIAIPSHFPKGELEKTIADLEKALGRPPQSIQSAVTPQKIAHNEEIVLIENISERDHTIIADYYLSFSRFIVRQNSTRVYHYGPAAAHVTGYLGPPTREDLESGVLSYQMIGKNGLEFQYESILHGEDGEVVQVRTARGEIEEQRIFREFIPGNNLILTIDAELQKIAYKSLGDKRGAIVAIRPANGEIVALVSRPSYDPNILVSGETELRSRLISFMRENKSELNRAISAKFPPASTFKPLVALAALEENRSTPSQTYHCPGKFVLKSTYGGHSDAVFYDWDVHGTHDMIGAIATSCSVYFYNLGYEIGPSPIIKYSRYFRLDQKTGIDLPNEITGFVPSPLWKEKEFNQRWFDGDTVNLSIGQGFIETTLLGMINFFAAIANNGVVYTPHLIREIRFAENDQIKATIEPQVLYELPISPVNLGVIKQGIRRVVTTGTARAVFANPALIPIAGKTGTVQTRSADRFANATQHAWFIGYGPFDGPIEDMIVVGVFVERGIGGSVGAAPVARDVFLYWSKLLSEKEAGRKKL